MLGGITITNKKGTFSWHQNTKNALDPPTTGPALLTIDRDRLMTGRGLPMIAQARLMTGRDLPMIVQVRLMTGRVLPTIGFDCGTARRCPR